LCEKNEDYRESRDTEHVTQASTITVLKSFWPNSIAQSSSSSS